VGTENASLDIAWNDRWDERGQLRNQDHFQAYTFGVKAEDGPEWLMSLLNSAKRDSVKFKSPYILFYY
jgi:hypothetical protein